MTRRWTSDGEERAAVAKKAQDSYSVARQALEKISHFEMLVVGLREELAESRAEVAVLVAQVRQLERAFRDATEPMKARRVA